MQKKSSFLFLLVASCTVSSNPESNLQNRFRDEPHISHYSLWRPPETSVLHAPGNDQWPETVLGNDLTLYRPLNDIFNFAADFAMIPREIFGKGYALDKIANFEKVVLKSYPSKDLNDTFKANSLPFIEGDYTETVKTIRYPVSLEVQFKLFDGEQVYKKTFETYIDKRRDISSKGEMRFKWKDGEKVYEAMASRGGMNFGLFIATHQETDLSPDK